jgi:hypothetical protein
VGKLYLPPYSRYFGCRLCHDLTYRSAQEHDKRADFFRKNPAALYTLLGGNASLPLRMPALKAAMSILQDHASWGQHGE